MYTPEEENQLIILTDKMKIADKTMMGNAAQFADALIDVLNFHDWRYYIKSQPIITDFEYDHLFKKLKELEESQLVAVRPDSPTQRVAHGLNEDFPTVKHLVPMMSLENSYNAEDLKDFDRKVREALLDDSRVFYTVELKYDGGSIAVIYENDLLVRAATRGNGVEGDQITNNAKTIKTIPLKVNFQNMVFTKPS